MGREIRRVPANYVHPTYEFANSLTQRMETRKQPMFDRPYIPQLNKWWDNHQKWEAGTHPDLQGPDAVSKAEFPFYAMWDSNAPDPKFYRLDWKPEEMTWFQVWETVSEGTPVTPAFATEDELIDYLCAHGDEWDQTRRAEGGRTMGGCPIPCDPWPRPAATAFVKGDGFMPTMVMVVGKVATGHEVITALEGMKK